MLINLDSQGHSVGGSTVKAVERKANSQRGANRQWKTQKVQFC